MKKLFLSFFAILLSLSAFADAVEINGIYYNLNSETEEAEVTKKPTGTYSGDVVIPKTFKYKDVWYSVTSIGDYAFWGCSGLTSITIPNSVTSIGSSAFQGCSGLTSIDIPNSVTAIGGGAFIGCTGLTSVMIGSGVTSIGKAAFDHCTGLTSVHISDIAAWCKISFSGIDANPLYYAKHLYMNGEEIKDLVIPNSVTSIGDLAFYCYRGLTSVVIPNSVTSIGDYAFYGCSGLTSVMIGSGVTSIGEHAFEDCTYRLTSVHISDIAAWCKISFSGIWANPLYYAKHLYMNGEEIKDLVIPNGVTSIGDYTFLRCIGLNSVEIPNSVTSIAGSAFSGCSGLTSVHISDIAAWCKISFSASGGNPLYYATHLYMNGEEIKDLVIPNSVTSIGDYTFLHCIGLNSVEIPNSVTSIGEEAFGACTNLTSVEIPNSVTNIGCGAFNYCRSLTSVVIPNSVTSIGEAAFYYCTGLTSVEIPNSVTSIGEAAFYYCTGLTSVEIPNSVTSIWDDAFSYCTGLTSITCEATTPPSCGDNVFSDVNKSACTLYVPAESVEDYKTADQWKDFENILPIEEPEPEDPRTIELGAEYLKQNYISPDETITGSNVNVTKNVGNAGLYYGTWNNVTYPEIYDGQGNVIGYDYDNPIINNSQDYSYFYVPASSNVNTYMGFYIGNNLAGEYDIYVVTMPIWFHNQQTDGLEPTNKKAYSFRAWMWEKDEEGNFPSSGTMVEDNDGNRYFSTPEPTSIDVIRDTTFIGTYNFNASNYDDPEGVILQLCTYVSVSTRNKFSYDILLAGLILKSKNNDDAEVVVDGLKYYLNKNAGKAKVIRDDNYSGYITIPESIVYEDVSCSVTSIGNGAFSGCSELTSLEIPNSVTSIGDYAFAGCEGLTSIEIPNSVTSIGGGAFGYCSGLTSIEIPSSVTTISRSAFHDCTGLTSVTIPNSITSISMYAFENCTGLTSVNIPNSVTSIGDRVFQGCTGLTSIEIPNSVTSIGESAFYRCTGLTLIEIPSSVTSIGTWAFIGCTGLTSITCKATTPPSCGDNVFSYVDKSACTLYVPKRIVEDYKNADQWMDFENILPIEEPEDPEDPAITFVDENVKAICVANWDTNGDGELRMSEAAAVKRLKLIFKNNNNIVSFDELQYFTGLTSLSNNEFKDCTGLTSITIPNSVTSIGSSAFQGCSGLTSITVPNSVTSINNGAFSGCTNLTSVTLDCNDVVSNNYLPKSSENICGYFGNQVKEYIIGSSVTKIGDYAFRECSGFTSFDIPNNVTSIGIGAFEGCSGLTAIEIPNNVTSIGTGAFGQCPSLAYMKVADDNAVYDSRDNCNAIIETASNTLIGGCMNTVIPNSVTSISASAFYYCSGLTSVEIPNGVISIGRWAFGGCEGLTSIEIPNSVTSIGDYAFYGCPGLTSMVIGNSVTTIGEYAFSNCTSLTSVTINSNAIVSKEYTISTNIGNIFGKQVTEYIIGSDVTSIGDYAFRNCSNLTSVDIPNSVTSIGSQAFYNCTGLTSIEIPSSVTSIADWTFYRCEGLTSIKIPNSVTSIGDYAFMGCTGLTSVDIPNSITSIGTQTFYSCSSLTSVNIPNSVTSIGDRAFQGCTGLTSIEIPNSVTSIGNFVFAGCTGLTSIDIPNSVTLIGNYAFVDCSSLTSITCEATTPPTCGDNVFNNVDKSTCTLYVPAGSIEDYKIADQWKDFENILPIPDPEDPAIAFADENVKTICVANWDTNGDGELSMSEAAVVTSLNRVFRNNKEIVSFDELQNFTGLTSIDVWDFFGCTSLTSIEIPNSVTNIGNQAFYNCTGLISIEIPNSVTNIGSSAFKDCTGLASIVIPNSVTSIGSSAFSGCTSLTSIEIPNSVTNIGSQAFYNCSGLISIEIPNSVTSIEGSIFYNCTELTSVKIPNSVTTIQDYAFQGCTSLTSVEIPNSVTNIGSSAFKDCTGLASITVEEGNITYDSRNNCNAIIKTANNTLILGCKNTFIPNSVTNIGSSAFYGCTGLTSIEIPNSVTSIRTGAFKGCTNLTSVTLDCNDIVSKNYNNDSNNSEHLVYYFGNKVKEYIIGKSITSIGDYAFLSCSGLTSFEIPNNVTCIGIGAFEGCSGLTSIEIPSNITSIGTGAFGMCSGLTSIKVAEYNTIYDSRDNCNAIIETASNTLIAGCMNTVIPNSVTGIGRSAFWNCRSLASIDIPNSVTSIGEVAFYRCINLTSIEIPNSVTSIGNYAFSSCTGLTSIKLPNSVTSIGDKTFYDCEGLTEVYCLAENVPTTGNDVFLKYVIRTATLYVPAESVEAYKTADQWKDFGNILPIPNETYGIIIADGITNGTIKVNPTSAAEGETITLTITPDAGYELATLTITGATSGEEIEYDSWEYTFQMPAEPVNINATFQEAYVKLSDYAVETDGEIDDEGQVKISATFTAETKGSYEEMFFGDIMFDYVILNNAGTTVSTGQLMGSVLDMPAYWYVDDLEEGTEYTVNLTAVHVIDYITSEEIFTEIAEAGSVLATAQFTTSSPSDVKAPITADGVKPNGKYLEKGKIVIWQDGTKFTTSGTIAK